MTSDRFDAAVAFVLRHEGEHSQDSADPGGDTWYGLSRRAYPQLDPWPPSRDRAIALYYRDYWSPVGGDRLPPPLALAVFDAAVNQGRAAALLLLQAALGVVQDGLLGPKTIAAANEADLGTVVPDFLARRALRYALNPQCSRFGRGWFTRLFHLYRACLTTEGS